MPSLLDFAGLGGSAGAADPFGGMFNVGGGWADAERLLATLQATEAARAARKSVGLGLLGTMLETQRDPFSIVPALQMYGAAGGGVQAPMGAFAATGGAGTPSPYGDLFDKMLRDLSTYATSQIQAQQEQPSSSPLGLANTAANVRNARRTTGMF